MAEINWQELYRVARSIWPLGNPSDPRYTDARTIVIGTEMLQRGKISDAGMKALNDAVRNFVDKSSDMIDSSIKDSSRSGLGELEPPKDPNDIFRPKGDSDSPFGELDPPKNKDDIYRLKDDKNKKDDKEEKKEPVKSETEEEDEEETVEVEDDKNDDEQNTAVSMPSPEGEDDYFGIHKIMPGINSQGEKDPFDVSDVRGVIRLYGDTTTADPWDSHDGIAPAQKFWGGDEPIPAWEKIGPKY